MLSKLKTKMFEGFASWCINRAARTPYEHLLNDDGKPFLHRCWLFRIGSMAPNGDGEIHPWFAVHVNRIVRSEEPVFHDEACHSTTLVLRGNLCEVVPVDLERWRVHITTARRYGGREPVEYNTDYATQYSTGAILRRKAWDWHFFRVPEGQEAWTLTISGPKRQLWGYLVDGLVKVPHYLFMDRRRHRRDNPNGSMR